MTAISRRRPTIKAEVIEDPSIMSGDPVIRGTRIPADTIVQYLRGGYSKKDIFEDYIVVGRPITSAPDPKSAAEAIIAEIQRAS